MSIETDQICVRLILQLHKNSDLVSLYIFRRELDTFTLFKIKTTPRERTFKNIRSSDDRATQSCTAVHFPIPPFAANLVQRASSWTFMLRSDGDPGESFFGKLQTWPGRSFAGPW